MNGIARFFRLKPAFEALRDKLRGDIRQDRSIISSIDAFSRRYHTVGMNLRNAGRALRGRDADPKVKPNGRLAELLSSPFQTELNCLQSALRATEKAIAALDRLDRLVPPRTNEPGCVDVKQSVTATMNAYKENKDSDTERRPVRVKVRHKEAEI